MVGAGVHGTTALIRRPYLPPRAATCSARFELAKWRPGAPTGAEPPMTIPAVLAAELDLLTQALDLPGADVAMTLTRLAADSQTAVDTYLGLSVIIIANRSRFDLTVLNEGTQTDDIRTSLAERDLYARAVAAGLDLLGAATLILASLAPPTPEPGPGRRQVLNNGRCRVAIADPQRSRPLAAALTRQRTIA